jgi:hypothetical protein
MPPLVGITYINKYTIVLCPAMALCTALGATGKHKDTQPPKQVGAAEVYQVGRFCRAIAEVDPRDRDIRKSKTVLNQRTRHAYNVFNAWAGTFGISRL